MGNFFKRLFGRRPKPAPSSSDARRQATTRRQVAPARDASQTPPGSGVDAAMKGYDTRRVFDPRTLWRPPEAQPTSDGPAVELDSAALVISDAKLPQDHPGGYRDPNLRQDAAEDAARANFTISDQKILPDFVVGQGHAARPTPARDGPAATSRGEPPAQRAVDDRTTTSR